MDKCKEPVSLRNGRLFNSVLSRSGPMQRTTRMRMSQEALLDAFILLYDECNKDNLRRDGNVTNFINKYRTLLTEIKSLRVNLNDFELKNIIGQGHFGEVRVVKEKQTNDIYAMKIVRKYEVTGKISSVLFEEEHDIMCTATSNWLTKLQYSFQDSENLYFIMEYHSGGDLLSLLDRHEGTLTPDMARFYLAETALAIKALHQMGYVHRDIKPDNILLDYCGHVKLADFGSSAKLSSSGLVTQIMPVGTPEYIAPEILLSLDQGIDDKTKKQFYGNECDYWSLGILAFELVVGRTPFSGSQIKATYFNIMNHKKKLKYPDDKEVPESLKDLISKLLEDPSIRLKHDGVIKHSFFRDTNWNNLRNEVPPFVPSSNSPDDVSNFIEITRKKCTPKLDMKNWKKDFSGKHLPFIGFTYSNVPEVCEKKVNDSSDTNNEKRNPTIEALLSITRKENKNLASKLFEAQLGKNEELEMLEKKFEEKKRLLELSELDRNKLQRDVAKLQVENNNLQRILELERLDRKEMESNALKLITENKCKIERNFNNQIRQLNSKIEEANDKLIESHTTNNELISKLDRTKSELEAALKEIEKLKNLETEFKNKMAEAREFKRKSVVGLESRLEKMANESQMQVNVLQQKLNDETNIKLELEEKFKKMEATWHHLETQLKNEIKEQKEKIEKLEYKVSIQHAEIVSLTAELKEKPNVALLQENLKSEKEECSQLRLKLTALEKELANSTHSCLDQESTIAAHEVTVQALEKELREASEEKIILQKKLQKTKEIDEENRQKLSNLEIVVDRLEQGVIKLEAENMKLKNQVIAHAHAQPITSEAEARYQEKISILEDQVAKLESQVEKLRESLVLEKESLRSTQCALWKTEKELSDSKIDIRIAKREAKTAEDSAIRFQDELRKLNEKLKETEEKCHLMVSEEREKFKKLKLENTCIKSELEKKETETVILNKRIEELKKVEEREVQLKKEKSETMEQIVALEKQLEALKEEKEKLKDINRKLETDKSKVEANLEELKQKISSLELNNAVLKETGAMLDEQLEDYDKFTTNQAQKIESLNKEKLSLEKEIEKIQNDLRKCRQNLNEEKSFRLRSEQKASILENELAIKEETIHKLRSDLSNCNALLESLKSDLTKHEEKIAVYEIEIREGKQMYDALDAECQWLKKEASNYLTNLYSLRESNYKLTQDLEEEHQLVEALQGRICELQSVITDLEAFHKQREVKDEATKQQQNKLITFLQEKLNDTKKKKTITDVLFGSRNKENVLPPVSPTSNRTPSNYLSKNKTSTRKLMSSPSTEKAISELVKSPTSQSYFQRQASAQRMHHSIPHKFKSQTKLKGGCCIVCQGQISRNQCFVCIVCKQMAHPKCANLAPKTCGLPQGLVKHYAKSVNKTNAGENLKNEVLATEEEKDGAEGPVKVLNSSKTSWDEKYAKLNGDKILIFEKKPLDYPSNPGSVINLSQNGRHAIIGEMVEMDELSNTAKSSIPFVIKIALIPDTTCWPEEIYYIMVPSSSDKLKWLAALNKVTLNAGAAENIKYQGSLVCSFPKDSSLDLNCLVPINEKLALLGAEEGIFSLKLTNPKTGPVKIEGALRVQQITLIQELGIALMIAEHGKKLVMCDLRALISNAEAASCANPRVLVSAVESELEDENCLMFAASPSTDGVVFVTVSTSNKLFILKWSMKHNRFDTVKILETLHPCSCIHYTKCSVIVGCDKFFVIDLNHFSAQEFLDPSIKSLAFWRIGSFPMEIFEVSDSEFLLCFNEFGVFVNESGTKTQCDLKWNKVPIDFAYSKPYLFIIHMSSVEVMRVPFLDFKSSNDSICTSSTATVTDSVHVSFKDPKYLGNSKTPGSIYIKTNSSASFGVSVILLEAKKLYKEDLGSCASLNTIPDDVRDSKNDGDEFSFTSSLVNSLENVGSSTPKHSDDESCTTYTISESENNNPSKKTVTFVSGSG